MSDRKKRLDKVLKSLRKGDKDIAIGFGLVGETEFIETPFSTLNTLTGGGLPRGKYVTIAGAERTAKGTLLTQTIGHNMQLDNEFTVLYTDLENALEPDWCELHGVDLDRMLVQRYSDDALNMERVLDDGMEVIATGDIDMWILDSVGAMLPKAEQEKSIEEDAMLNLQRKLGLYFRKAAHSVHKSRCCVVLIGQIYEAPQANYVDIRVKGGNAMKHWAHLRLMTRRGNQQEGPSKVKVMCPDGEKRDVFPGWAQHVKVDKTRLNASEGQEVILQFVHGRGLDSAAASITALLAHGVIERAGAYYRHELLPDGQVQGKEALINLLRADEALREQLVASMDQDLAEAHIDELEVAEGERKKPEAVEEPVLFA